MRFLVVLVLALWFFSTAEGQFLRNPSFEGEGRDNNPPLEWWACDGSPDNPPLADEILVELPASDGERYLSMRARADIPDPDWEFMRGVRDKVSSELLKPLIKGVDYELSIDLATDYEVVLFWHVTEMDDAQLRLWGGTSICEPRELLASTGAITNTEWETFSICFSPQETNYTWFFLEADFIDNDTLNGMILIDNLKITQTSRTDTAYYEIDADFGDEVTLEASLSGGYVWSPSENLDCDNCRRPSFLVSSELEYLVQLINPTGCFSFEQYNIVLPPCRLADSVYSGIQLDTVIDYGESVQLEAKFGSVFSWSPDQWLDCADCNVVTVTPESSIEYLSFAYDEYGCEIRSSYSIEIRLFVPNAITPNYDHINDVFEIKGLPEGSSLSIMDRLGKVVLKTDNYQNDWPYNSMTTIPQQTDTYWYLLEPPGYEPIQGYLLVKF